MKPATPARLSLLLAMTLLLQWPWAVQSLSDYKCEGELVYLTCPAGSVLLIRSAMFGRKQGRHVRCGQTAAIRPKCEVDITQYMKFQCEGYPTCQMTVEMTLYGPEFCPEVMKYAEVDYDCVAKADVDGVQRCSQKCLPPGTASSPTSFTGKYEAPPPKPAHPAGPAAAPATNTVAAASSGAGHGHSHGTAAHPAPAAHMAPPAAAAPAPAPAPVKKPPGRPRPHPPPPRRPVSLPRTPVPDAPYVSQNVAAALFTMRARAIAAARARAAAAAAANRAKSGGGHGRGGGGGGGGQGGGGGGGRGGAPVQPVTAEQMAQRAMLMARVAGMMRAMRRGKTG